MYPKLLVTVDTEALPARACGSHVKRLIWGEFENGVAGIREMVEFSHSLGVPFLFFLEVAGALDAPAAYREVGAFLQRSSQNVELHFHPEIIDRERWKNSGVDFDFMRQDLFSEQRAFDALSIAVKIFSNICGKKPNAYRAGSFRWNRSTLKAMEKLGLSYSFNSCMETTEKENFRTYCSEDCSPFMWSNGIVEVPCGEPFVYGQHIHLRYPRKLPKGVQFIDLCREAGRRDADERIYVILLHSWSFLERDKETGHYYFKDYKKMDGFYEFLEEAKKEFEFFSLSSLEQMLSRDAIEERQVEIVPEK